MTREEAAEIIFMQIADRQAANQIATALDALGLLNLGRLAYHPDFKRPGVEPEDISRTDPQPAYVGAPVPGDPLGRADPAEAERVTRENQRAEQERIGSLPPPPDAAEYVPPNPSKRQRDWATFRERER
jgi:hypothetical protein